MAVKSMPKSAKIAANLKKTNRILFLFFYMRLIARHFEFAQAFNKARPRILFERSHLRGKLVFLPTDLLVAAHRHHKQTAYIAEKNSRPGVWSASPEQTERARPRVRHIPAL